MSSFKRIPKTFIKPNQNSLVINDKYIKNEEEFKKETIQEYIEKSKARILEQEEKMLKEIELKRESLIQEAYEKGKTFAYEEARQDIKKEIEEVFEQTNAVYEKANQYLDKIIEDTEETKNYFLKEKKGEIIEFVLLLVKEITKKEIKLEDINYEKIYQNSLDKIKYDTKKIIVKVHPKTKEILSKNKSTEIDQRIELRIDLSLEPIDMVIETDREFIDAKLDSQLEEMKEFIRGVIDA